MSEDSTAALRAERDQLAAALAERNAQLDVVKKEFDQFIYSVSHDLRAPLRAIEGFAQILVEDYSKHLDADGQRCASILVSGARKATLLIEDLLSFSRLGRKPFLLQTVNMNELTAGILREMGAAAGKAQFRVEPLPEAWADPVWLGTALEHLLRNAEKFSRGRELPVIEIGAKIEPHQITYQVRDNGAGFDQRYADRLFGVFQRLHGEEEFEGRGIGLAIVRRVINRHNGKVWAEGKVGEGAVFSFSLPTRPPASTG